MPSAIVNSISTPAAGAGADDTVVNYPSGTLQHDLLIIVSWIDAGVGQTVASIFCNGGNSATGAQRAIACNFETATGSGAFTLGGPTFTTSGGAGDVRSIAIALPGGSLDASTPFENGVTRVGTSNSTSCAMPTGGIVSTGTDELGLVVFFYKNTGTITSLAGFINDGTQNDGADSWNVQHAGMPIAATIAALTATLGTTGISAAFAMAIKPLFDVGVDRYANVGNVVQVG